MISKLEKYSPKEAAGILGCSVDFVRAEIKCGKLPVIRVNQRVYWIQRAMLDAYIARKMMRVE